MKSASSNSQSPVSQSLPTIVFLDHTAMLGGGEIALLNLVSHLDRARFQLLVILSSPGPLEEKLREVNVETIVLPLSTSLVHTRKDHLTRSTPTRVRDALRIVGYSFKLARLLKKRRASLLHTNSLKADIFGGIAGRLARVPVLWHVRDRIETDYLPAKAVRVFRWLARRLPHYVITNSQATLDTLHLTQRARVVHDGIAVAETAPEYRAVQPPKIGIVGRISPWKGQHIFLEAAKTVQQQFPEARFQIIGSAMFGEEEYEQKLHAQALKLDLGEQLEWLGFRGDVPQLIDELTILVHASTMGEPFGQVVIEGMVAGKPVIATRGGGVPEIVRDGVSGVLVPMNDAPALSHAMLELLRNPARMESLSSAGYERVRDHFRIQQTAEKVETVYDLMLQN